MALARPLAVRLASFEGPLDLLLELIRKQKLDIFDIPIAEITAQYLAVLEEARRLDLDVAGEYLVMASTLMQIKARMLLPRHEEDAEDPREELVAQLLAYEEARALAEHLDALPRRERDWFARPRMPVPAQGRPEADLAALVAAFAKLLRRVGEDARLLIRPEPVSVRARMQEILARLAQGPASLEELCASRRTRAWLAATLLALLELWRRRAARIVQSEPFGAVMVYPIGTGDAESAA